jgi:PKD repeat protein
MSVQPNATIDLSLTKNKIIIELALNNTPDVPPINGVLVQLTYDTSVLTASSLNYSTNIFNGYTIAIVSDCLDGHGAGGVTGYCHSDDGPGITTFAETILGAVTPDGTEGNIFFLTFNVNTTAPHFSQIAIKQGSISKGNTAFAVKLLDGYYTSLKCGNVACSPAFAKFTWTPKIPTQGTVTIFNASSSLPSPGAFIKNYTWAFGDAGIRPYRDTFTNSTATYIYQIAGNFSVTLKVTDSNGVKASKTQLVSVINTIIDMGIENLDVQPSPLALHPGVIFTITALLRNYGGLPTNTSISLSITINAKVLPLGNLTVMNMKPTKTATLTEKWDSTPYPPNVYRVDAITPLLKNETLTDGNPNHKSFWIQLIPVQPGGSLDLLSVAGVSIVVVGAGGYGVSFLRKRNTKPDDAL